MIDARIVQKRALSEVDWDRVEATDFIAFLDLANYFSAFSAQKSHVKSQNHLTHY
jgi:hypothetical protein